jgi:hypothetical protein
MLQDSDGEFELASHVDAFGLANRDLAHRARTLLREDQAAEQTYRQLARDLSDSSAKWVFGLLVRETQADCELLQRVIDETLDDSASFQDLARGNRRHAEQLRDLACAERGSGHAPLGAILDALARDGDKHASLLLELECHLLTRC